MNLSQLKATQKSLISLVYQNFEKSLFPHFLFYSYLGARICYAESHPLALFYEEKFKTPEKFKAFLLHLKNAKHYSVFAHTPVFVKTENLSEKDKCLLSQSFFKVFWDNDSQYALFNLRHLAENLDSEEFEKIISIKPELSSVEVKIFRNFKPVYDGLFLNLSEEFFAEKEDVWAEPEVIIIRSKVEHPFDWIGVIAHNFSRIFSHQFVRHTWLNFNQRSHRYTKVNRFVVPSVFNEEQKNIYRKIIDSSFEVYRNFSKEMKKESARFVIPQGVATTVLATAPLFVWEDFVSKRAIPQAQEEIRNLAYLLKEVLF